MKKIILALVIAGLCVPAMASTKAKWKAGHLEYFESKTQETVLPLPALQFYDEFIRSISTIPVYNAAANVTTDDTWRYKFTGTPTVSFLTSEDGGGIYITLDVTASEAEQGTIYMADLEQFNPAKNLGYNTKATAYTLPTTVGTAEVGFGLMGPVGTSVDGSGNALMFMVRYSDTNWQAVVNDAENTQTITDTGVAAVAGTYHDFRIECYDTDNVRFFIDGNTVATSAANVTSVLFQPFYSVYKAGSTGGGALKAKFIRIWQDR